ncbi:hypothetical protein Slin15195_G051050 [Septoria linicola]|uniref:Uncharacterized protein n=1 Tax=Septoria linicola TaxID=215465 RepID=A0A9Q9ATR3_9PEZI|nr:hypothetical protein Slin15195_G051050 [Septoria linicola]
MALTTLLLIIYPSGLAVFTALRAYSAVSLRLGYTEREIRDTIERSKLQALVSGRHDLHEEFVETQEAIIEDLQPTWKNGDWLWAFVGALCCMVFTSVHLEVEKTASTWTVLTLHFLSVASLICPWPLEEGDDIARVWARVLAPVRAIVAWSRVAAWKATKCICALSLKTCRKLKEYAADPNIRKKCITLIALNLNLGMGKNCVASDQDVCMISALMRLVCRFLETAHFMIGPNENGGAVSNNTAQNGEAKVPRAKIPFARPSASSICCHILLSDVAWSWWDRKPTACGYLLSKLYYCLNAEGVVMLLCCALVVALPSSPSKSIAPASVSATIDEARPVVAVAPDIVTSQATHQDLKPFLKDYLHELAKQTDSAAATATLSEGTLRSQARAAHTAYDSAICDHRPFIKKWLEALEKSSEITLRPSTTEEAHPKRRENENCTASSGSMIGDPSAIPIISCQKEPSSNRVQAEDAVSRVARYGEGQYERTRKFRALVGSRPSRPRPIPQPLRSQPSPVRTCVGNASDVLRSRASVPQVAQPHQVEQDDWDIVEPSEDWEVVDHSNNVPGDPDTFSEDVMRDLGDQMHEALYKRCRNDVKEHIAWT